MAGLAAAVSAAREGLQVVLMHERPVLGGNASSEVRMWICGADGQNNRETGLLEEIMLENMYRNPTKSFAVWDTVLYDFVKREKNITLLLNCTCMDASIEEGAFANRRSIKIKSVTGYQMTTQQFYEVHAKLFCDCSGDSILAPLCRAECKMGREAAPDYGEDTEVTIADSLTMGTSCLIQGRETEQEIAFIPPEWCKAITHEDVKNRFSDIDNEDNNFWYLELGGDKNTITDSETTRDELITLALGMWDYVKNRSGGKAEKWDLDFLGFLPAKRESRRMCGEYTITQRDIFDKKVFVDEIAFGGWPIDDHYPGGFYHKGAPNKTAKTPAPYSIPYRALYSKNVENLFFAGRNISMTHMAMSSIRVMATCTLLGEAVGKAASIAVLNQVTPHEVYLNHTPLLQEKLLNEDCFLPSKTRKISEACFHAVLEGAGDQIRNGQDRAHDLYGTSNQTAGAYICLGSKIKYTFPRQHVKAVHVVFDSDLNRETLNGSWVERTHATRANTKRNSPQLIMPGSLCKAFTIEGTLSGKTVEILKVEKNRKRSYHIEINQDLESLTLIPINKWGDGDSLHIFSFDFC